MKDERITIRVTEEEKKEINVLADKYKMNTSQFVYGIIKDRLGNEKLSDSQEQFISIFNIGFKKSYEQYFRQLMVVLNRIDFNTRWSINQQDIFMQHLKVPQTKDELNLSIIEHPITEVAHEKVVADLRKMSSRKKELEDE